MTYDETVDLIAEEMWQAESIRIQGRRRTVEWPHSLHQELVASYRLTAMHLMDVISSHGCDPTYTMEERE